MLKTFADYFIIFLVALAAITHILKIIYVLFKPGFMDKIKYISNLPGKTLLLLYYILVVGVCVYVIYLKSGGV